MSIRISLIAAAAALALGGCSGVAVYDDVGPQLDYFDGDFAFATHKGAIITDVGGNPFNMPADRFSSIVRDYMYGANRGTAVAFTPKATAQTILPYRVVAMFNLAPGVQPEDLCRGTAGLPTTPPSANLRLDMAFCFGDGPKTEVAGVAHGVSGPQDPKVRDLVRKVTLELVPAYDLEDVGETKILN